MSSLYTDTSSQSEANFLAAIKGQYKLIKLVGRGSYGYVYEATALEGNQLGIPAGTRLAIKVVRNVLAGYGAINAKRMLREICILRNLDHPNIMKFRGLISPVDINSLKDLYIVCDYVVTDLHKILHSDQPLSNKHVQYIVYQLLKSVCYLHERDIIHRDIKPANLLIDERVSLKLCDFGLARSTSVKPRLQELVAAGQGPKLEQRNNPYLPKEEKSESRNNLQVPSVPIADLRTEVEESKDDNRQVKSKRPLLQREYTLHVATRWYRAPELILQTRAYTTAIDIWSVGCILAELINMQLDSRSRSALFPGDSCYPLSPVANKKDPEGLSRRPMNDQMKAILDVIGTPSMEEVKRVYPDTWEEVWAYISSFGHKDRVRFTHKFTGADDLSLQLLHCLLEFDPRKRPSAREALRHPYLKDIVKELDEYDEVYNTTSKSVDKEGNIDPSPYFDFEEQPINVAMAQALLVEQVLIDNRTRCADYVITREFAHVMNQRELTLRNEINSVAKSQPTKIKRAGEIIPVQHIDDVSNNTQHLHKELRSIKNCNRYSFVFFPPHHFKAISCDMNAPEEDWVECLSDDDHNMGDVTAPEVQTKPMRPPLVRQDSKSLNVTRSTMWGDIVDKEGLPDVANAGAGQLPPRPPTRMRPQRAVPGVGTQSNLVHPRVNNPSGPQPRFQQNEGEKEIIKTLISTSTGQR